MPMFKSPAKLLGEFAESKLESIGVRGELSEHEVDTVLDPLYDTITELERTTGSTVVKRTLVKALRRGVGELELLLLPERQEAFSLLGVRRDTKANEVKQKFRALAMEHHPDRTGGDAKMMRNLNRAYAQVKRIKGMD